MSWPALDWAFNQEVLSSSQKFVLVALANHANETTLNAFPSIETLCRETELDRKTVIRSLDRLVSGGWITETGRRIGKTGRVKVYYFHRLTVPKTEPLGGEMVQKQSLNGSGNSPVNGGAIVPKTELRTGNREPGTRTGEGESPGIGKALSGAERISAEKELDRIADRLQSMKDRVGRDVWGTPSYDDIEREEIEKLKDRREELKQRLGCVV